MPITTRRHSAGRERGAALIIAIGVLTLLLVIALTFFRASIGDVRTSVNTVNGVRAELMADGATSIAMAFLSHDQLVHPLYTSLDSAWRTYFNGAFAVGKPWMWAPLEDPSLAPTDPNFVHRLSLLRGGIPEFDPTFQLFNDNAYIPRSDYVFNSTVPFNLIPATPPHLYSTFDSSGALQNPFVTTGDVADPAIPAKFPPIELMYNDPQLFGSAVVAADLAGLERTVYDGVAPGGRVLSLRQTVLTAGAINETLPYEQIHFWTDVDNDGDGFNDSMWLPWPTDRLYPDDGLDNDLDGRRDEFGADGIDQDPGDPDNDDDEDGEPGVFMYRADTDDLDNDADGVVDEADEFNIIIFTLRYPFLADLDGNGSLEPTVPTAAEEAAMGITGNDVVRFEGTIDQFTGERVAIGVGRSGNEIYSRDNDLDLVLDEGDDASHYMFSSDVNANGIPDAAEALLNNNADCPDVPCTPYFDLLTSIVGVPTLQAYAAAGRVGPLPIFGAIRGETMTELGGRFAVLIKDESGKVNMNVAGSHSYSIDKANADPIAPLTRAFASGVGPHEFETRVIPYQFQPLPVTFGAAFAAKIPDYRNGSPEGLGLNLDPSGHTPFVMPPDDQFALDISLPGYGRVDDNANVLQLALNSINDDGDATIDEGISSAVPGLGFDFEGLDEPLEYQRFRPFRDVPAESNDFDDDEDDVDDEVGEFGDTYYRTHQQLKNLDQIAALRFDVLRNFITVHSTDRNERHFNQDAVLDDFALSARRQTTGLRKDLNVTRPQDVASAITREWSYPESFAELRALTGASVGGSLGPIAPVGLELDFLRGMRQENVTVFTADEILGYPARIDGNAFSMLADAELRAHQLAATIKDFADLDYTRSVDDEIFVSDTWWSGLAGTPARISYTTAGIEAIRINEVMVRPVRRVEAEATTLEDRAADPEFDRGLNPNRFVPHDIGLTPLEIEEAGFRIRVRTTSDALLEYNANRNPGTDLEIEAVDQAARWDRVPNSGLLGLASAWSTYRRYLTMTDPDTEREFDVPDVLQISFQATEELPADRYYLTVNTQMIDDTGALVETVVDASNLLFAVKTGTFEQDWFADVMNIESYARGGQVYNQAWRVPAMIGSDALGGSAGMAFLQGDATFSFDPAVPAGNPFSTTLAEFLQNNLLQPNLGFTILVPERDTTLSIEADLWVHIAIRSMHPDGTALALNYFDFSQEPDHEWLEVANISDDTVDLSGWSLAVENHPLNLGPMTIPAGTQIAPGGLLLLGTNKFDYAFNQDVNGLPILVGDTSDPTDPDLFDRGTGFFTNGIGLASGARVLIAPFENISVPRSLYNAADLTQGSVFEGTLDAPSPPADYIDRGGDGVLDSSTQSAGDIAIESTVDPSQIFVSPTPNKPWDRIVELVIPGLVPQFPQEEFEAGDVGRIVLGGGIFPNRPEFDLIDNDEDNGFLELDQIDNNGDGVIDEVFEGRDEGRFARDEQLQDNSVPVPGSFNAGTVPYVTTSFTLDPLVETYWDGALNPPQWKEFMERRNFPGDSVVVTLYEGPANNNEVADRVTYSQRDVDNRAVDDILFVNDFDTDRDAPASAVPFGEVVLTDPDVPIPLDDRFPSMWPENTMGIDFARSLERKHPLYTGDRVGTRNRFQATDGDYDDWSDSTNRWERVLATPSFEPTGMADRLDLAYPNHGEFVHAVSGTPLRMNEAARFAQETTGVSGDRGTIFRLAQGGNVGVPEGYRNAPLVSPADATLAPHTSKRAQFTITTSAAGELFISDASSVNISLGGHADTMYDSALIGQRFDDDVAPINFFKDLRAFVGDVGTTGSISLNAGQARVIQIVRPLAPDPGPTEAWQANGTPPARWAPLLSFPLPGDLALVGPYDYARQYLFQPLTSLPATVDSNRWPLESRPVLYASRNYDNFDASVPADGAQALFVWDGDDGLENGEYDVYIVATEDLSALARADDEAFFDDPSDPVDPVDIRVLTDTVNVNPPFITGVGAPFVAATQQTANREVSLDIELFRDSNGDRKCWITDIVPGQSIPDADLQRGNVAAGIPFESFGEMTGAQPEADGMIHYGVVRVQNNFLALSLRNRGGQGVTRFSRVILSARNKTPGRLNVNTVETTRMSIVDPANPSDTENFYNPLIGVPGVLLPQLDDAAVSLATADLDPAGQNIASQPFNDTLAQSLARHITEQRLRLRSERPDGRYYEMLSDLMADAHNALIDHPVTGDPVLRPPLVGVFDNLLDDSEPDGFVDSDANRAGALAESAYRLRRMQNLLATRSDVFEILVTVQAGYGTDANGDGRINWRDDDEFTVTAEKTARTVYER